MTIKEAIEYFVFQELNCDGFDECSECPIYRAVGDTCFSLRPRAAKLVKEWLDKMPEDALPNVTIADLL